MDSNSPDGFITVVSGLPRSGTSMMMAMLAAGGMPLLTDQRRPPDRHNPNGYFEHGGATRLREHAGWLESAPGKAVKIVSMHLFDLPSRYRYRILFMERELCEVLDSQRAMMRLGEVQADVSEEEMLRLYETHLTHVRNWLDAQPHMDVFTVQHRAVLSDPLSASTEVNGFLGGLLSPAAMAGAVHLELYRSRRHSS